MDRFWFGGWVQEVTEFWAKLQITVSSAPAAWHTAFFPQSDAL